MTAAQNLQYGADPDKTPIPSVAEPTRRKCWAEVKAVTLHQEAQGCACRRAQRIPVAYFASACLKPYHEGSCILIANCPARGVTLVTKLPEYSVQVHPMELTIRAENRHFLFKGVCTIFCSFA